MRKIAIIGAGQAGLLAAHALLKHGYSVTVFSDRTPEDFLNRSRPTGSAARFKMALDFERELGLNHWEEQVPRVHYAHVTLCEEVDNRVLTLCGRLKEPACAVDLRLQSHRWMKDFTKKGGSLEIENVTVPRLDEIAGDHDLTIVAAGKGEIQNVFERDESRCNYTKAPRKLAMVCVTGNKMGFEGAPGLPVKFNLFPKYGECFWGPWYHKDHGPAWSLLIEAKEGGPLDKFDNVKSGEQALEITLQLIKKMMPWDYEWARNAALADEYAWLAGSFVPSVRKASGKLPSGRIVMPLGDTAVTLDPVGGQGANNANKMARNLVECIINHGDRPFNAEWMHATFEKFWLRHHWINKFTNILLSPMTDAGKELFIAQYGSTGRPDDTSVQQMIADELAENFNDPALLTNAFTNMREARRLIERCTGKHWLFSAVTGRLKIGWGQILQKLGQDPRHPSTAPFKY